MVDASVITDGVVRDIGPKLHVIIAEELNVAGNLEGWLTPDQIEVCVHDHHPLDLNVEPLQIRIIAHDVPERAGNIDERREAIIRRIKDECLAILSRILGTRSVFVWILLTRGSFGFL